MNVFVWLKEQNISLVIVALVFILAGVFFLSPFGERLFFDCDTCMQGTGMNVAFTLIFFGALLLLLKKFGLVKNTLNWRILFFIIFVLMLAFVFFSPEIFSEDAYEHYLISKYSLSHPVLFLDQWNKPLFTVFTFLFAQVGLWFMRVSTILASLITLFVTIKNAEKLKLSNGTMILLLCSTIPFFWLLSTAPMTEIFFAMILSIFLYFFFENRLLLASFFVSMLPFVRQEGFLFLGFFLIYCIVKKEVVSIPVSLIFPVLFTIIGLLVSGDVLWVLHSNPYLPNTYLGLNFYGHGSLIHYPVELSLILGPLVYFLLFVGSIQLLKNKGREKFLSIFFFLFGIFHALIWYLGLFYSAGYARVFVGLLPIIALISAYSIENFKKMSNLLLAGFALICFVLIFFSPTLYHIVFLLVSAVFSIFIILHKAFPQLQFLHVKTLLIGGGILVAIVFLHFPQDYSIEHKTVLEATNWIKANSYDSYLVYADSPSAFVFLGKDAFDKNGVRKSSLNAIKGSLLLWDSHFSPRKIDENTYLEQTKALQTFTSLRVKLYVGVVKVDINSAT